MAGIYFIERRTPSDLALTYRRLMWCKGNFTSHVFISIKPSSVTVAVYITTNCKPRLIPVKYNFHILLSSSTGLVIEIYFTLLYIVLSYCKMKKDFSFTNVSNMFFPMTHSLQYYCMKNLCPLVFLSPSLPPPLSLSPLPSPLSPRGAETSLRSKLVLI